MKHSSFDATISALDASTSALDTETSALDAETSALGAETLALGAATSAIARSYRHGVFGDYGVGITPQMCNRVTNHGDMGTFYKPVLLLLRMRTVPPFSRFVGWPWPLLVVKYSSIGVGASDFFLAL